MAYRSVDKKQPRKTVRKLSDFPILKFFFSSSPGPFSNQKYRYYLDYCKVPYLKEYLRSEIDSVGDKLEIQYVLCFKSINSHFVRCLP